MQRALSRYTGMFVLLALIAGFALYAAPLGPDANWDLRNYHLYDPFALLHGRLGYDIAPAQRQTYLAPQLDMINYVLRHFLNRHPALLNGAMSLSSAVETFLGFLISRHLLPAQMKGRTPLALLAALIGATGAAGLPTVATSSTESIPGSLCLGGFLLILTANASQRPARTAALAGLLLGAAAGLKLTTLPYCVAAAAALLLSPIRPTNTKWLPLLAFGAAGAAGALIIGGPWWLLMEVKFQSPLFPFYNQIFHSPYYFPLSMSDERFKPPGLLPALFYPFYWAADQTPRVTELPMRDPRFAAAFVLLLFTGACLLARRGRDLAKILMFVVFFALSYILWETAFSIFRYLAPLEMLTGTVVLVAWRAADPEGRISWAPWAGLALLGCLCLALTQYPDWGRAPRGPLAVDVRAPALPPNSLVIMLDESPMAYVAAFEPSGVRFVGANNNLLSPGQGSELDNEAEHAIRSATAPLWGLEFYPLAAAQDDATLQYYGLHRVPPCLPVISNIDANALRLCPLARN